MKRFLMALAVSAASMTVAAPSMATIQAQSPLVGSWELVKSETVRPNGESLPFIIMKGGENPTGIVMYNPDGWMSVQIGGAGRPVITKDDPDGRDYNAERAQAVVGSYYGYYGRFETDPAAGKVRHIVKQALHPDEVGQTYERRFRIEGDLLMLMTPSYEAEGEQRFNRLSWRRVKPQPQSTRK